MVEEEVAGEEGVWCGEMVWIRERMRREGERELYDTTVDCSTSSGGGDGGRRG